MKRLFPGSDGDRIFYAWLLALGAPFLIAFAIVVVSQMMTIELQPATMALGLVGLASGLPVLMILHPRRRMSTLFAYFIIVLLAVPLLPFWMMMYSLALQMILSR